MIGIVKDKEKVRDTSMNNVNKNRNVLRVCVQVLTTNTCISCHV